MIKVRKHIGGELPTVGSRVSFSTAPDNQKPDKVMAVCLQTITPGRRAAAGRAELLANFLGGAVWGVFRENANCGDPPGTLRVPCTFRRGLIWKIRQKSGKIWAKSSKICQN